MQRQPRRLAIQKQVLALLFATCITPQQRGEQTHPIQVAEIFTDHMVLQRDQPITIWGTAQPATKIQVRLGKHAQDCIADASGHWKAVLLKQPANPVGQPLSIRAGNHATAVTKTLHDVLIGDVWLCTGQSNMRWQVNQSAESDDLLAVADCPTLRLIDFRGRLHPTPTRHPLTTLRNLRADNYYTTEGWQSSNARSAASYSAVAFAFGRQLCHETKIPIGLIHNAVGGAPMEAFLPREPATIPKSRQQEMLQWWSDDHYPSWCHSRARQNLAEWFEQPVGAQPHHPFEPSFLFDAGIAPLAKNAIRGVIWYQGESNATEVPDNAARNPADNYAKFAKLIQAFRSNWENASLPFLFVQLPGLNRDWATFREVQDRIAREVQHAAMAVTIDLGTPSDVHPRQKAPVGHRLARLALARVYDRPMIAEAPTMRHHLIEGHRVTITLDHATTLRTIDNQPARGFLLAGEDRVFHEATASLTRNKVTLASSSVPNPVAVRYAFSQDPDTNLVNQALLPAAPFRTDAWPEVSLQGGGHHESFEDVASGPLVKTTLSLGSWQADTDHAEITNQFAHTGNQCLHIHGGKNRTLTLQLKPRNATQLSFWAERWTARMPFEFRIEARRGNKWSKIYDGSDKVRVGRSFLTQVKIDLPKKVRALRFIATSPAKSGVLIDDIRLTQPSPMRVHDAHHATWVAPALRGKTSPITKVLINATGQEKPINIQRCTVAFSPDTPLSSIESVRALGQTQAAQRTMTFRGALKLSAGRNELIVAVNLAPKSQLDGSITASVQELTLSNGVTLRPDGSGTSQRLGITLRTAGQDNCHTYRIPGLTTTNDGTLIAVYDNRYRSGGDLPGDIDVGMSRSTNGGSTWEPMRVIMDMGNNAKWNYDGIGDPEVMVDRTNGRIWVAATWSHGNRSWNGSGPGMSPEQTGQLMLAHSDDDGKTWSHPRNITPQVKDPAWRFVLQGPGRGITMNDGTLVLAAQYRSAPDGPHKGKPFSTMMSSRDQGETWQIGTGVKVDTTESQLVELDDGLLMINCRDNRRGSRSVYTTSDLGKSWQIHPTSRSALIEPTCMASILRVDHKKHGRLLFFSNPNTKSGRYDMTLKVSNDSGATWPSRWHTRYDQRLGAGYSCLTQIDAEHIGVLYEGQRELYFLRFSINELLAP